jgi:hypothetical protein
VKLHSINSPSIGSNSGQTFFNFIFSDDCARAENEGGPDQVLGQPALPLRLRLRRDLHQRACLQVRREIMAL